MSILQRRLSPSRVLIADDEDSIRCVLSVLLRGTGFETVEATDGTEALRRARQGVADVMLLDLMMPGLTGMQVLRELRGAGSQLPVVILTGSADGDTEDEAARHGVSSFLSKPFKPQEVVSAVWAALQGDNPA
jgi:CheY-like chemotaxis protein